MTVLKPLSLALAFTLLPLAQADTHIYTHSVASHGRHRRQAAVPAVLPGQWTFKGCYVDNNGDRSLQGGGYNDGSAMTTASCINYCDSKGFIYAGTEYSIECYCGNTLTASTATASDCSFPCSGAPAEACGAGGRLNVYWSGKAPPPPPSTAPTIGDWKSLGCYTDNINGAGRTLGFQAGIDGPLTQAKCTTACFNAGYPLSGAEYAAECYCGNTLANGGVPTPASDCGMLCAGNSLEFCGGPNRLNVYNYTGTAPLPPQNGGGNNGGGGGNNGGGNSGSPVTSGLPGNWKYAGCWVDNAHGRIFSFDGVGGAQNTIQSCIASCQQGNYTVAGTEYGVECYCGNNLIAGATVTTDADCAMGCAGNATQGCGGPNRVSVYSTNANLTVLPVPKVLKDNLPGNWTYQGCLRETGAGNPRVLPYQIIWPTNNTQVACMNQCAKFGFSASGVEYGQECYCGDVADVTAAGTGMAPDTDCSLPCPGDPLTLCGAGDRLSYYTWNGTMTHWNRPENIGRYEFFVPGVVIPLVTVLGINNKISILEKTGTGFPNSTGAYELDPTLVSNFSATWREMHLKTDVFCSASLVLPDKAGRHLNVGGWSLESTYGVRIYWPDGAPGVNGTRDWQENYPALKLQRGRWYPTAAMLANGTILVVGGETGSNAPAEPTLEILPKPDGGDTVLTMDWLQRTDPNNLYPFIFILPSKRVFISYWNEARILDPATFETVLSLPNAPGSVNNFLGGRTYPLAGAAMLFPMHAPYTDPVTVIMCGGSTEGPGEAIDNCVTVQPEVENPVWTIERMPSRRVMACMVALPDGTFMIMNGAQQGVAGFGLSENPNLSALLYDPYKPSGQRISILNNTIIARLYHSELTLLPDARVMISGSDPQHYYPNGTEKYPEEFRFEVYVPPYLNQGFKQPEFDVPVNDWEYGKKYTITNVKLYQGTTATMRVSLLSAVASTHGNTMGQRTLFPEFSCSGTTCTITAPPHAGIAPPSWHQVFILDGPTPSHSKWVRIGGDPAGFGNWPQVEGFDVPGLG